MNFSALPPAVNSARIFAGARLDPLLAATTACSRLAEELGSAAASFMAFTARLLGGTWQGTSSTAIADAAALRAGWPAAAAHAQQGAFQATFMAAEIEAVQSAVLRPILVAGNRLVSLVVPNLFGESAPAIAAGKAVCESMWVSDVSAMAALHARAWAGVSALAAFAARLPSLAGLLAQLSGASATAGSGLPGELDLGTANIGIGDIGGGNFGNNTVGFAHLGHNNGSPVNWGDHHNGFANFGYQ